MSTAHIPAELRRQVQARAGGHCEYCRAPAELGFHVHQLDHIIAQKHGGESVAENLAMSCIACNQFKGSDLSSIDPATKELVALFHPRQPAWRDHFELRGLFIIPKTGTGRVTVNLLQLNAPERIIEREWFIAAGAFPDVVQ
jgi:5-methylcytosine-specific restriction endonuclease McrA